MSLFADENHYYISGYDVEKDPYCNNNGVLINLINANNTEELNAEESDYSANAIQLILKDNSTFILNLDSFKHIHFLIFQDVYPWAGNFRLVDIRKNDSNFLTHHKIEEELKNLIDFYHQNIFDKNSFKQHIGQFLSQLNYIHPFREGNGRTQRTLISLMAKNYNLQILWNSIAPSTMVTACIAGMEGDFSKINSLFRIYSEELKNPSL